MTNGTQIEWTLNILDIIILVVAILTIFVTIYLAYHVQNIHSNINDHAEITHQHLSDIKDLLAGK